MKTYIGQMNGLEWQEYCQKLIRLRHSDYQKMPSRFGGDLGVEGFTRSGILFQCYCPDDNPGQAELFEKQKTKISKDIKKLIKNVAKISQSGASVIAEWHFFTPDYDHRGLLSHCVIKEMEVKKHNFKEIDANFKILLQTEADYLKEIGILRGAGLQKIQSTSPDDVDKELKIFLKKQNKIVSTVEAKLAKLPIDSNFRGKLLTDLLKGYIIGKNELDLLNQTAPTVYEAICKLKTAMESQLGIRSLTSLNQKGEALHQILTEYESTLSSDFSSTLSKGLIARLSMEAISDWLGRCPLDFPSNGGAHGNQ